MFSIDDYCSAIFLYVLTNLQSQFPDIFGDTSRLIHLLNHWLVQQLFEYCINGYQVQLHILQCLKGDGSLLPAHRKRSGRRQSWAGMAALWAASPGSLHCVALPSSVYGLHSNMATQTPAITSVFQSPGKKTGMRNAIAPPFKDTSEKLHLLSLRSHWPSQ